MSIEEAEKTFRKEMQEAGVDNSTVKSWIRVYERTKKLYIQVGSRYERNREDLCCVREHLLDMEQMLIGYKNFDSEERRKFQLHMKELKKFQGTFQHEFLISKEDVDFHTTYDSVMKLGLKYVEVQQNGIILHSEVENLIALTNEALDRKTPDLFSLSFFYLTRSDRELRDLPFPDKMAKIQRIYENEFLKGIPRESAEKLIASLK